MKETINRFYGINIDQLFECENYSFFYLNNESYYFVPLNRNEKELQELIACSQELKTKKIECHDFIYNIYHSIITENNNNFYILFKINGKAEEAYDISDILEINNKLVINSDKAKKYQNNWDVMWSHKIDYFEYQIRELGKGKEGILNSFSYYVGLAENAIAYVNQTNKKYTRTPLDSITLSHRRIFIPNIKLNYLNPLSFIFDLEVRDVGEYIKNMFFYGDDAYAELEFYLKLRKLSVYGYQMLYARLLYPSYYFDLYEKIMNDECTQEELIKIINKNEEYELFLKRVYYLICNYIQIEGVEWIINKKEL